MNLTGFALDNSRLVSLLLLVLVAAGVVFYLDFPSREDPNVTVREAVVTATYPGMSPRRVEDLITRKLEKKIRLIPEVKHIVSTSGTGQSVIHVHVYEQFYDMGPIWQNLRNKMRDVRSELPEGTLGPFVDDEFGDVFSATIAMTASGFEMKEMREEAQRLRDELYTVDGTKKVVLHGLQEERIFLETTNARLAGYGLSPDLLIDALRSQNIIRPGGRVESGKREIVVEPTGNFRSIEDIGQVVIPLPGSETNGVAYLEDILTVRRAYADPPETRAYFDGKPAIVAAVSLMDGHNVLEFSPRLRSFVEDFEGTLPIGYELRFATYQARYVSESVQGVAVNVYETLGIVLFVVVIFLGLRTGLIVGTVVPLTMLVTIVAMRVWGIELQRVSLATMIIALGLLVDNGIVMAEEIGRRLAAGEERRDACIAAGASLALPLLTSSLTTIFAFVPLALAPDDSGEYLRSMAQVILITLMASWLLALLVTPLMCFWWMSDPELTPEQAESRLDAPVFRAYRGLLLGVLRWRVHFLVMVLAAMVASGWLMGLVPQQFMPDSPRNQFMVYVDVPAGYSPTATDEEIRKLLGFLDDRERNPEVVQHVAYMGYGGPRFFQSLAPRDLKPNIGFVLVTTADASAVDAIMARTRQHLMAEQPAVFPRLKKFWLGTSETGLVQLRVSGRNADELMATGQRIADAFRSIEGSKAVHNDWENRVTKVEVEVDQPRARRAGVSSLEVADSLDAFFSGQRVSDFREGDKVIPILMRASGDERHSLDRVRNTSVYSPRGERNVPLAQVADFEARTQLSRIKRRDLERTITIAAKHEWLSAVELQEAVLQELGSSLEQLPEGWHWEWGGETESSDKANVALATYVPHALAAMVLLMVWQFNSFAKPAIIFASIPMTFIGSIVGLYLTGAYFGFMATLGFLSLAGIIINNAIVLLESIQGDIDGGRTPFDAVMHASVERFQPVMMTTLTTVLGLVPLMIPADPLFAGMAIVISFGVGFGTLLTLLAVPALYTLFFRVPIEARPSPLAADARAAVAG